MLIQHSYIYIIHDAYVTVVSYSAPDDCDEHETQSRSIGEGFVNIRTGDVSKNTRLHKQHCFYQLSFCEVSIYW